MKNSYVILVFILLLTSGKLFAQKDSIALQRESRKFVREGNKLYDSKNYTDAAVSYKKALEKNSAYKKATYNMGNACLLYTSDAADEL